MLYIKKSTLPGAGKGLFADRFIKKGTRIVEYTGDIITWKEYDKRAQKNHYRYLFYIDKNHCIDAYRHPEALARYANDARGAGKLAKVSNNSMYDVIGKKCYITAFRNIAPHSEILVGYGAGYWRDIQYNHRMEKLERRKKEKLKEKIKTKR